MYLDSKTEITLDLTKEEVDNLKMLFDKHVDDLHTFGQLHLEIEAAETEESRIKATVRIYGETVVNKQLKDFQDSYDLEVKAIAKG